MPITTNYSWTTPTDGGSTDAWGGILNTLFTDIDTDLYDLSVLDAAKLPLAGGTMTGRIDALNSTATVVAKGNISGSQSINCALGQGFTATIASATTFATLGFTNCPAGLFGFVLELTLGSNGVTWPASVLWAAGAEPNLSAGKDILGFITFNSGTSWYGVAINLAAA